MDNKMEKDRAGVIPYIIYILYTIFMTVVSVTLNWPSWITAVINCGLLASIGLRVIYGRKHILPKLFSSVMVWVNVLLYSIHIENFINIFGSIAAVIVMLSLFDFMAVNYISLVAVFIIFNVNIFLGKVSFDNPIQRLEFIMQFVAIVVLTMLEKSLLKNRIRREEALAKTMKELEDAQRGKDDFMANVSHEIRTPLNAIIGIGDELLETNIDDATRDKLYDICVSGRNLMSLVSDILDFSELQNDSMELVEEPYNITSVINDVVNMANAWNKEKKLELIIDCESDIPNCLMGDSQKLYRIIINIVNNAIKFTDNGGVILFVGIRKEEYGVNLMIKVQDTGIGMSEECVACLEKSYNQVDTTRDRRSGGVGLGIAISRKMVSKMNGHMHISSVPEAGTTVSVIIPQKVLADVPIVSVKGIDDKKIIFYMDLERYSYAQIRDGYLDCIQRMIDELQVDAVRCSTMHELEQRILHGSYDFLFIADVEYLKSKDYFDGLKDKLKVVVMANRDFDTNLAGENVQLIYRPMQIFSIVTVLRGEVLYQSEFDYRWNRNHIFIEGAKVLAVDDSAMNLKVVSGLMRRYGIVKETALSGKEAIHKVENRRYDIIFMDHMMPEMDGVECMHKLRELPSVRNNKTPIIALTANAISGAREMLMHEGFDDFVAKPIEKSCMERVLRKFLSSFIVEKEIEDDRDKIQETIKSKETFIQKNEVTTEERSEKIIEEKKMHEDNNRNEGSESEIMKSSDELNVAGIDYQLGLHYFDNDKEDYLDILKCFYEQGKEQIERFEKLYESKDWKAYRILVHSLKGLSLTIGAAGLSENAKKLQFAAEKCDEEYISANHQSMIDEYTSIIAGLSKYMGADEDKNLRQKLMTSFDEFNQEASIDIIERIKAGEDGSISDEDIKVLDQIKEYVDLFDFNSAAEILKKLGGGLDE